MKERQSIRTPSRNSSPLLPIGLCLVILIMGYSYWNATTTIRDLRARLTYSEITRRQFDGRLKRITSKFDECEINFDRSKQATKDKAEELLALEVQVGGMKSEVDKYKKSNGECQTKLITCSKKLKHKEDTDIESNKQAATLKEEDSNTKIKLKEALYKILQLERDIKKKEEQTVSKVNVPDTRLGPDTKGQVNLPDVKGQANLPDVKGQSAPENTGKSNVPDAKGRAVKPENGLQEQKIVSGNKNKTVLFNTHAQSLQQDSPHNQENTPQKQTGQQNTPEKTQLIGSVHQQSPQQLPVATDVKQATDEHVSDKVQKVSAINTQQNAAGVGSAVADGDTQGKIQQAVQQSLVSNAVAGKKQSQQQDVPNVPNSKQTASSIQQGVQYIQGKSKTTLDETNNEDKLKFVSTAASKLKLISIDKEDTDQDQPTPSKRNPNVQSLVQLVAKDKPHVEVYKKAQKDIAEDIQKQEDDINNANNE